MGTKKTPAQATTPKRPRGRPFGSVQSSAPKNDELEGADAHTPDVDAALAEIGNDALEVVLFQQDAAAPTEWPYLARFPANDFSLEAIKVQHGGGKYRARILGPGKRFLRQITFQIHRSYRPAVMPVQSPAATGGASETPAVLLPVLEALRQQGELSRAMLAEVRELRTGGANRTDPLEYALKINQLITSNTRQSSGFSEILTVLEKGMELGGSSGQQSDSGAGYAAVISQFGVPLLEYLKQIAQKENVAVQAPRPQLVRNFPPDRPPEVPNLDIAMPAANAPAWLFHLRPLIPYGITLAHSGADPESFAPALYQIIPDVALEAIEAAVQDPNFSLAVLEAYPDTQQYRDWFVRLLEAVKEIVLENRDKADPPAQAATG